MAVKVGSKMVGETPEEQYRLEKKRFEAKQNRIKNKRRPGDKLEKQELEMYNQEKSNWIRKMTKLTQQNLPPRGTPFYYCEKCNEWVPFKNKHDKKRHKND